MTNRPEKETNLRISTTLDKTRLSLSRTVSFPMETLLEEKKTVNVEFGESQFSSSVFYLETQRLCFHQRGFHGRPVVQPLHPDGMDDHSSTRCTQCCLIWIEPSRPENKSKEMFRNVLRF